MGISYFLAIEAISPKTSEGWICCIPFTPALCASGCSHYLTDTEIWKLCESHPYGSLMKNKTKQKQTSKKSWTNFSSPVLITQPNQSQFSQEHPVVLIKETHSPARIHLPTLRCFVCADIKQTNKQKMQWLFATGKMKIFALLHCRMSWPGRLAIPHRFSPAISAPPT